jgi:lipopolysaccharide biosynthesis glycosyltransferase
MISPGKSGEEKGYLLLTGIAFFDEKETLMTAQWDISNPESIQIVCCADEKFMPLTATMLMSLVRNHHSHELLSVSIINDGISITTQKNLEDLFSAENIVIHWFQIDPKEIPSILGIPEIYNHISCHYYRLLMPYLLPQSVNRAIYLDVDLIVLQDISELWKIDFQNQTICAVQDFMGTCGEGISNCLEFGISPTAKYFNSGVLLIDLKKWREQDISKKAINCRLSNEKAVVASKYYTHDQFGLNVILHDQWQELDPRWNYSPGPGKLVDNPCIVHYCGDVKPWNQKCKDEFRQAFIQYLNQTPYKEHFAEEFKPFQLEHASFS